MTIATILLAAALSAPPQAERYFIEPWLRQPLDAPIVQPHCVPVTIRVNTYRVTTVREWDGTVYEYRTLIATRLEKRYICDRPCEGAHDRRCSCHTVSGSEPIERRTPRRGVTVFEGR